MRKNMARKNLGSNVYAEEVGSEGGTLVLLMLDHGAEQTRVVLGPEVLQELSKFQQQMAPQSPSEGAKSEGAKSEGAKSEG